MHMFEALSKGSAILPVAPALRRATQLMLGALHPERDREDIARFHLLHQWFIERPHERKWVRCRLRHTLPLKEPVLAQVDGSFHLPGGKVEPHRDRQVITGPQRCVHLLLVHRRQAEQKLRVVSGCFSLRDAKDALPLPVALDQGGNPEDCFKHMLLLSMGVSSTASQSGRSTEKDEDKHKAPSRPLRRPLSLRFWGRQQTTYLWRAVA